MNEEIVQACYYLIADTCECDSLSDDFIENTIKDDILCIIQKIKAMDEGAAIRNFIEERNL
ncbi:MAG: hypothetical protein [Caudoviricetes sp.]|nr:MAG: hypothetical protein [Caudoviricetes sp.]